MGCPGPWISVVSQSPSGKHNTQNPQYPQHQHYLMWQLYPKSLLLSHISYRKKIQKNVILWRKKKVWIQSEAENYIIEHFMLLKIFQQRFAYDLCNVVSCLARFQECFTQMCVSQSRGLCKHHWKKHTLHVNLVFRVTNGVDKVSIQIT